MSEDQEAWRESALLYLVKSPEERAALAVVGSMLLEHSRERLGLGRPWPESPTRVRLRAVAVDLRYLERVLGVVGSEHLEDELTREEQALSLMAGSIRTVVGGAATFLEEYLRLGAGGGSSC